MTQSGIFVSKPSNPPVASAEPVSSIRCRQSEVRTGLDGNAHRRSAADLDRTILDTARAVFETYGVRRANIEDVAARAGVSRSTIYRRFPTKDDLFEHVVRREAELFFTTLDQATTGCNPQEAVIEAFALGCAPGPGLAAVLPDRRKRARAVRLFSRSHVFPIGQFADGIAHTLRRCGADIPDADLANIADILLRVALGIIVFPTDRLDTSDHAAVRDYAARYLVPIIGR